MERRSSFPARRWSVRIRYREPGYELRAGPKDRPYSGTFVVHAASVEDAIRLATSEFEQIARRSSVGWVREIVEVHAEPMDPPSTP